MSFICFEVSITRADICWNNIVEFFFFCIFQSADGSFSSCIQGPMVQITAGVWRFNEYHIVLSHYIVVRANKQIDSRKGYLRGVFNLSTQTPLLVTFQLPPSMLEPDGDT